MKKNVVGRVLAQKQPLRRRISALHIPAWLTCFLLAILIWLAVVNLFPNDRQEEPTDTSATVADEA